MRAARDWGRGKGELVFHGDGVSAGEDQKVLEVNGGAGCTAKRMYLCH